MWPNITDIGKKCIDDRRLFHKMRSKNDEDTSRRTNLENQYNNSFFPTTSNFPFIYADFIHPVIIFLSFQ